LIAFDCMGKSLKQFLLVVAIFTASHALPLGLSDAQALTPSCTFTYHGPGAAPNDSTSTETRALTEWRCPNSTGVEWVAEWSTTPDMNSTFLTHRGGGSSTGSVGSAASRRQPDTSYYVRVSLVEYQSVNGGGVSLPRIYSDVAEVRTKSGPDTSLRPPPDGWTYPRPEALRLVSQIDNGNGVSVSFVVPAFPAWDSRYMSGLAFELRHGGDMGSVSSTGLDPTSGTIFSDYPCNCGYNITYTAALVFNTMSSDGTNWIRNVASSITFTSMWNPAFPTTTTVPPTTTKTTRGGNPKSTSTTTTTTVAPSTTVPKVGGSSPVVTVPRPLEPGEPQIALLSSNAVRVSWGDSGMNESGYIIQRSDNPVSTGVSTAMWPYKTAANATSYDFSGLAAGSQVCFAVASFNNTGASKFSEWGCLNLSNPGGAVAPPPDATLSCDGVVARNLSTGASFKVSVGASNAGRLLGFEYYEKGKWTVLGQARVDATGAATLTLKSISISKVGSYPIRATQGSRFICEGDLTVSQKLKAYRKK
jgi:hypothetical protein